MLRWPPREVLGAFKAIVEDMKDVETTVAQVGYLCDRFESREATQCLVDEACIHLAYRGLDKGRAS